MRKRASGAYQIEIRDRRLRGGRLAISSRTAVRTEARRREAAVRALLDRGDLATVERLRAGELHIADLVRAHTNGGLDALAGPEVPPLGDLVERVMATIDATKPYGTRKQYAVVADQLLREFGADFDPASLTREAAQEWLHRKRGKHKRPWAPRTQAQKCALAGRIWRDAGCGNPWREVEMPEVRATRFAWLQPEEWQALIRKVRGLPVAAPLALGTLAGLRQAEVIHLRPGVDVDIEGRRLRIQRREGAHPWRPKTERGERELRIGDELLAILTDHIGRGYSGGRYLVRTPGPDVPIHASTLARWTRDAFDAVGIQYGREGDGLTFHSLRHTFASWLVQRDVQLMKVARLLGDTELEVARTYGHLLPADLDRAVDLVDLIGKGEA